MAETDNKLHVRLVTPDQILIDESADAVELPSKSGYMEVLYGHAPLLAELGVGEVRLHGGSGGDQTYFVVWGFVEVLPDRVTILAQNAIKPEQIDTGEAQRQLESDGARRDGSDDLVMAGGGTGLSFQGRTKSR